MANAQIVVTANTRQAEAALGNLNRSLGGISSTAVKVGSVIAGVVTGATLRNIVQTTARFQDLRTTLSTVAGGAREGAQAFDFIQRFATQTQFGVEELTQTYIKLQTAGITPTTELLTTFTDAAAVTTDQLGSLEAITDLFSRTTAGGLGLEELNRLADRGIPVFDILQQSLGRNRLQLSELGKTAEGAQLILQALTEGINQRFGGATEARINNVSVQFSNLQIAITAAADAIGSQGFAMALGQTAVEITNLIENNQELVQEIGVRLTQAFLVVRAGIKLVIDNIKFLGLAFGAFFALKIGLAVGGLALAFGRTLVNGIILAGRALRTLTAIAMANPLLAAAVVLAGGIEYLTGAFSKLFSTITGGIDADSALDGLQNAMGEIGQQIGINTDSFEEFFAQIGASEEEARRLAEQARAISQANGQAANNAATGTNNLRDQANTLGQVKKTYDEILQAANRDLEVARISNETSEVRRAILTAELDLQRQLTEEERSRLTAALEGVQAEKTRLALAEQQRLLQGVATPMEQSEAVTRATGIIGRLDPRLAAEQQYQTDKAALQQAEFDSEIQRQQMMEQLEREHQNRLHQIKKDKMAADLQMAGVTNQGILDAVSKSQDNIRMMEQGGVQAAMGAVDQLGMIFTQLGTFNKEAFEAAKAFNIANAIMNTYMGATKALATYPPPFNFMMAAAVVASGLAQVAQIRSQQFSGRQLGGPVMGGSTYMVGENGPELFTPNTTGSITRNGDLGMGAGPVNVNFTIVANDTAGFDELLTSRQGLIRTIISDAMLERGNRSIV